MNWDPSPSNVVSWTYWRATEIYDGSYNNEYKVLICVLFSSLMSPKLLIIVGYADAFDCFCSWTQYLQQLSTSSCLLTLYLCLFLRKSCAVFASCDILVSSTLQAMVCLAAESTAVPVACAKLGCPELKIVYTWRILYIYQMFHIKLIHTRRWTLPSVNTYLFYYWLCFLPLTSLTSLTSLTARLMRFCNIHHRASDSSSHNSVAVTVQQRTAWSW